MYGNIIPSTEVQVLPILEPCPSAVLVSRTSPRHVAAVRLSTVVVSASAATALIGRVIGRSAQPLHGRTQICPWRQHIHLGYQVLRRLAYAYELLEVTRRPPDEVPLVPQSRESRPWSYHAMVLAPEDPGRP